MPEITLPQGTIHYRDAGEAPIGEQRARGGHQRGAGRLGAFVVLRPLDIHTVCIHYAYSLYAT